MAKLVVRKVELTNTRHILIRPYSLTHWVASSFSVLSFSVMNCFSRYAYSYFFLSVQLVFSLPDTLELASF